MVFEGGLPPLITMLRSKSGAVQEHACVTLRHLTSSEVNRGKLVKENGVLPLIELLRAESEEIKEQAAGTLHNLAIDAEVRGILVQKQALPADERGGTTAATGVPSWGAPLPSWGALNIT